MAQRELEQHLQALRNALQTPGLGAEEQEHLQDLVADVERQLALPPTADPAGVIDRLRDWEARLAVDHPVVANVLTETIRKLEAIGI